ncbi:non-heme chloroperoxidase [Asanoa ishikariensis]|uniref:Non-heme chloroperoxidase n=1 Tax=Asanoa ishikariensis TaxID=137265 RepID=A0A1H3R3L9_9ACTN|nr:alpha/beta hydrolase [Asanoa ishikariensis]GIF64436.1 non-heme chloroperoxidase [Asanoa ishikariensis]SDZ20422.1 non-heme chloroperoxidase [Asanoa ishikariensis]
MTTGHVSTNDNTDIFFKDWGSGQPVVFSHGWPLTADAWDDTMMMVADNGFRGIAHDRRGGGRSSQPWEGNDLDHYADDLAEVIEQNDLNDVVLVGHSTGGGEIARYVGRHGTDRVSKMLLVGAIPPLMLKTDKNPDGLPIEVFDQLREGVKDDRSQFYHDLAPMFFGANRKGSDVSQGILDDFWEQSMTVGIKGAYDCIEAFSETDQTADLKAIDVPTLFIHGDDDQIVPFADASKKAVKLVKDAELKVYPGAPHGLFATEQDKFQKDVLDFLRS